MKRLKLPSEVEIELKKVSKVAGYLWQREWAERNAGNISMNLTSFFKKEDIEGIGEEVPFNFPKGTAGFVIFITGTGCYLRDLVISLKKCLAYYISMKMRQGIL